MLLVYSQHITPRVEYIFEHLLNNLSGIQIDLTSDLNRYCSYEGPSLNYSFEKIKGNEIHIQPDGLLFVDDIIVLTTSVQKHGEKVSLYLSGSQVANHVFDPFAASFYLLSRYEEYFSYNPDIYNRFEANSSILYKHQLLDIPLVDKWAEEIKELIVKLYPTLSITQKKFRVVVTVDIDQAFAFKTRGIKRNALSFFKNISVVNIRMLAEQMKVLFHLSKDPFDSYDYLQYQQQVQELSFIYFINVGRYSTYDKNLPPGNKSFQHLLKKLKKHADLGLHPSYYSNEAPQKFIEEKQTLENIISEKIKRSRQHFLKLYFPHTYRQLIAIGIEEDYSMGYASFYGFRAGTCNPFLWFDLEKNLKTQLKVFPITFMDGTFMEDLKLTPEESSAIINNLRSTTRQYNGFFIPLWHNHTVSNKLLWKNWREVFEKSLDAGSN